MLGEDNILSQNFAVLVAQNAVRADGGFEGNLAGHLLECSEIAKLHSNPERLLDILHAVILQTKLVIAGPVAGKWNVKMIELVLVRDHEDVE